MEKNNKTKIAGGAAVAAAAATAVAGAVVLPKQEENVTPESLGEVLDPVAEGEPIAEGVAIEEETLEGGVLSEAIIVGSHHIVNQPASDTFEPQDIIEGQLLEGNETDIPEAPAEEPSLFAQNTPDTPEESGDMQEEFDPDENPDLLTKESDPSFIEKTQEVVQGAIEKANDFIHVNSTDDMSDMINQANTSAW